MYAVAFAHEELLDRTAGGTRMRGFECLRLAWPAIAALAGATTASCGLARGAEGEQGYSHLDDSCPNGGPAEHAVFGKDRNLPRA
jgi:hypothetical protein